MPRQRAYLVELLGRRDGEPDLSSHFEHFSVPEEPDRENYTFTLKLASSQRSLVVPPDKSATDVLFEAGLPILLEHCVGFRGTFRCRSLSGDVDHRDYGLSNEQRETDINLRQSRASKEGGTIEIDLRSVSIGETPPKM